MQFSGSFPQSVLHLKRSQGSQPIGGVLSSPLSSGEAPGARPSRTPNDKGSSGTVSRSKARRPGIFQLFMGFGSDTRLPLGIVRTGAEPPAAFRADLARASRIWRPGETPAQLAGFPRRRIASQGAPL